MKVVEKDKAHIQVKDLEVVIKATREDEIPKTLIEKFSLNKEGHDGDFIEFTNEEDINFISSLDSVLDYSIYSSMSLTNILNTNEKALIELNRALRLFEEAVASQDESSIVRAQNRVDLLRYKTECLKELIKAKRGPVVIASMNDKKKQHIFSFKSKSRRG